MVTDIKIHLKLLRDQGYDEYNRRVRLRHAMVGNITSDNVMPDNPRFGRRIDRSIYSSVGRDVALALANDNWDGIIGRDESLFARSSHLAALLDDHGLRRCTYCGCVAVADRGDNTVDGDFICRYCIENSFQYSEAEEGFVHDDDAVKVWATSTRHFTVSSNYADDNYRWQEYGRGFWATTDYARAINRGDASPPRETYRTPIPPPPPLTQAQRDVIEANKIYTGYMNCMISTDTAPGGALSKAYNVNSVFNPRQPCAISVYHKSKEYIRQLPSPAYDRLPVPLRVGFEIEMETNYSMVEGYTERDRVKAARQIKHLLNGERGEEHYCLIETDGSVTRGFEVVTAWSGLDTHERILSRFNSDEFKTIIAQHGLKSHDTTTCGLHVTIDRGDMSQLHKSKMVVFMNHPKNRELIEMVCRRYATGYCKIKAGKDSGVDYTKVGRVQYQMDRYHERYDILNFTNPNVIEFRGPKGTLRFETIMATAEFIRMVWQFTNVASAGGLTTPAFLDFVWRPANAAETKYLRPYLIERKVAQAELASTGRLTKTEAIAEAMAMGFIEQTLDL